MKTLLPLHVVSFAVVLLALGCNSQKKATTSPAATLTPERLISEVMSNAVSPSWMVASLQMDLASDDFSVGVNGQLKLEKNKQLWISIKKFGFEVGRALITTDSVFVLDRMNKQYAKESLQWVTDNFGLPAEFTQIQDIVLGNAVFLSTQNPTLSDGDNLHTLSINDRGMQSEYWFSKDKFLLERQEVKEPAAGRSLQINLLNYADAGLNREFSYLRQIAANSKETGAASVKIQFNNVEFNVPSAISFSIPDRYTPMSR